MKPYVKYFSLVALSASLIACVGGESNETEEFDFLTMMTNYADNIILPAISDIDASSVALTTQLDAYCDAIDTASENSNLQMAQAAYLDLMGRWQFMEMALLGPLAEDNLTLRNRIYSYSEIAIGTCPVDQAVVLAQEASFDITNRALNHRGLGALEYLLFNEDLTHNCPNRILETQGWDDLPEAERKRQRCEYAQDVLQDIDNAFIELDNAWDGDQGNYRSRFINPSNTEMSLSGLTEALFYLELIVKDIKLGRTLGLQDQCNQLTCPEYIESIYANASYFYLRQNLEAFLVLFNGAEGLGFDDFITQQGFPEVVTGFQTNVNQILDILDAVEESFTAEVARIDSPASAQVCENSASNPDVLGAFPSCNIHGVLTRITNDLKSDFITIVNIDLPDRAQSDND